jgi:hypothetical protein
MGFWGCFILQSFIGKANRKIVTKKVVRAKGCDIVVNGVGEGGYVPGKKYEIVFSHYITSGKMAVGVSAGTLQMGESDIDAGASICSLLVSESVCRGWM